MDTLPQTGCEYKAVNYSENTVSKQEMMQYMFMALDNYNKQMNLGQDPIVHPLNGRIIMKLNNGKSVEIPENIQRMAIMRYLENQQQMQQEMQQQQMQQEMQQQEMQQEMVQEQEIVPEFRPKPEPEPEQKTNKLMIFLCILLLIFILYKCYKYYKMNMSNDF
jgi:hypothetical protein